MFETDDDGYMFLPYHLALPGRHRSRDLRQGGRGRQRGPRLQEGDLVAAEEIQWCGGARLSRRLLEPVPNIEDLGFTIDGGFAEYLRVDAKYCWSLN